MSDLVREQLSAFMDGELPNEECTLLLKRVASSTELAACWRHWHLIGDTLRGEVTDEVTQGLAARVNRALDAAQPTQPQQVRPARPKHWLMRRSATLAAGVAVIGLAGLVGALVSRQMGGGEVLVPGSANHPAATHSMRRVDWNKAPQPVRAELNRYLLMHEVYGAGPIVAAGAAAIQDSATAPAAKRATGTDGP